MKNGITSLVFQKKYMGSYCDIYLHKNVEESYLASRNGHLINYIDNEKVVLELQKLHQKFDWNKTKIIIIQSELLPWHVLGKGLIQNEFFEEVYLVQLNSFLRKRSFLLARRERIHHTWLDQLLY